MFEEYQFGNWRECDTAGSLRAHEGTYGGGSENIVIDEKMTSWDGSNISPTLTAKNAGGEQRMPDKGNFTCVTDGKYVVRRLTPTECERLQSLPDGWTKIPHRSCSDSARYRALGNGMAQCCPTWLLKRLVKEVNAECEE